MKFGIFGKYAQILWTHSHAIVTHNRASVPVSTHGCAHQPCTSKMKTELARLSVLLRTTMRPTLIPVLSLLHSQASRDPLFLLTPRFSLSLSPKALPCPQRRSYTANDTAGHTTSAAPFAGDTSSLPHGFLSFSPPFSISLLLTPFQFHSLSLFPHPGGPLASPPVSPLGPAHLHHPILPLSCLTPKIKPSLPFSSNFGTQLGLCLAILCNQFLFGSSQVLIRLIWTFVGRNHHGY